MHPLPVGAGLSKATNTAGDDALSAWGKVLSADSVIVEDGAVDRWRDNCSGVSRQVTAVLLPDSVDQVRDVVRIATEHRQPIHPISRGRNWGLGSKLPVTDGAVIVDLSRLDTIREVGDQPGQAVIEPGVTQGQLFERLSDTGLRADVTGAGREASVVGNILERGVGWTSLRLPTLLGLEVVLATGQLVQTGFARHGEAGAQSARAFAHPPGPALDGLFTQSAMGVVTAATVALRRRQPVEGAFLLGGVREPELEALIDGLRGLLERGIVRTVVHIGDARRATAALGPRAMGSVGLTGAWTGLGGLHGTKADISHALKELRIALKGIARVVFLTPRRLRWLRRVTEAADALAPIVGMAIGDPDDAAVRGLYDGPPLAEGQSPDLDQGTTGLLCQLPVFPLDGAITREVLDRTHAACAVHAVRPRITLNTLDPRTLEAVIDLPFDRRDDEQHAAAAACHDDLFTALARMGVLPYRAHTRQMGRIVGADDPFWSLVGSLRAAVDPAGIISPGRYSPSA